MGGEVKLAAQGHDIALQGQSGAAAQVLAREGRKAAEVLGSERGIKGGAQAGLQAFDDRVAGQRVVRAGEVERVDLNRLTFGIGNGGVARQTVAHSGGERRVCKIKALGGKAHVPGERANAVGIPLQRALERQLGGGERQIRTHQLAQIKACLDGRAIVRIIGNLKVCGLHLGCRPAQRQQDGGAIRVGDFTGDVDQRRPILCVEREAALNPGGFGPQCEGAQVNAARCGQARVGGERHVGAKEIAVARGEECCDIPANVGSDHAVGLGGGQGHLPCQTRLALGGDPDVGGETVKRSAALNPQVYVGLVG